MFCREAICEERLVIFDGLTALKNMAVIVQTWNACRTMSVNVNVEGKNEHLLT